MKRIDNQYCGQHKIPVSELSDFVFLYTPDLILTKFDPIVVLPVK